MRFFTIILVLLTTSFFANQSDSLKLKNWAIGATFSPDYCYRMPYKVKPNLVSTNTESAVLGITTGFNVLCRLSNIIAIETGILYSTKGQRITNASWLAPNYDYYDPSIPNSGSPTVIPEPARQNVFTYNAWKALNRQVRKGEKGIKCVTWIETNKDGKPDKLCRSVTVFHISQTDPIQ